MLSQRKHKRRVQEFAGTPYVIAQGRVQEFAGTPYIIAQGRYIGKRVMHMYVSWRFFKEIRRWKL